jgi:hypothetical protein
MVTIPDGEYDPLTPFVLIAEVRSLSRSDSMPQTITRAPNPTAPHAASSGSGFSKAGILFLNQPGERLKHESSMADADLTGSNARKRMRTFRPGVLLQKLAFVLWFLLGTIGPAGAQSPISGSSAQEGAPKADSPAAVETPTSSAPMTSEAQIVAEIPEFHLTQVQLDAEVLSDRVNILATIEVMINRGSDWHRVPLRLAGAHVLKREYSGPGEEAPDVAPRSSEEGLVWMFRGLGKHQLKLSIWLPIKRTVGGGQFQLSLPTLAPFEAHLRARIPEANALVRPSKNLNILDVKRVDGASMIEASIVGNLLAFAWQTPLAGGETVSLVQSWIHLKPSAEHLSLVVEQNIELQQSTVDQLLITLPPEFRLVQLSGSQYRSHEILTDSSNRVRVHFTNDSMGRLTLRWVLERELSAPGRMLKLEGFHVEGAVREEGVIRIDEFENLRMIPRPADSELVHRIGVNQVRTLGTGVPLTAYEYLKQPFRLVFDIQPTTPYFSIAPIQRLRFQKDFVELTSLCPVRFEQRGAISDLRLIWPGWATENWHIVAVDSDAEGIGPLAYDATSQPGVIRLWWPDPLTDDATFRVVFRRPYPEVLKTPLALTLPVPQASQTDPTQMVVESADQLTLEFFSPDGKPLPRAEPAADSLDPVRGATSTIPGGPRQYRIEDPSQVLSVRIESHDREIHGTTLVEVKDATLDRLLVRQTLQLNVKYGRLRTLDLVLPAALRAHIPDWAVPQGLEVRLQDQKLPLEFVDNVLRADLLLDRIGVFDVTIDYGFPLSGDQPIREIELPLITIAECAFSHAEFQTAIVDTVQVRSSDTSWEALQTSPSQARWINPLKQGPLTVVPLTVGRKLADSSQQYVVNKVLVRTIFAADGSAESWAEFQLESPQNRLVIQLPPGTEEKEVLVDHVPLPRSAVTRRSGELDELTIALPPQTSAHPRIAMRYRSPLARPFGLTNEISLPLPGFPKSVWVDETLWEMQLPEGYHLFTYPDLVPQFHWVRKIIFWEREPTEAYLAERSKTLSTEIPKPFRFENLGFYAFRGFGPVENVSFRSMNRSLILLIGAGFALLLGFIFWRLPATRNVFSLIVISFLFAAASLWYLEPMLLLLQPAILGIVLALTATVIDSSSRPAAASSSSRILRPRPVAPTLEEESSRSLSTRIYQPIPSGKSESGEG